MAWHLFIQRHLRCFLSRAYFRSDELHLENSVEREGWKTWVLGGGKTGDTWKPKLQTTKPSTSQMDLEIHSHLPPPAGSSSQPSVAVLGSPA